MGNILNDLNVNEGGYFFTTDKSKIDVIAAHEFLSNHAYWCKNIPFAIFKKSFDNSLCFAVFENDKQIGFGRVISDYATIAYLGDVYVLPEYRGKGISKLLMTQIMAHKELQGLRRWILLTGDAHGLYKQFGWEEIKSPDKWMEIARPNIYSQN